MNFQALYLAIPMLSLKGFQGLHTILCLHFTKINAQLVYIAQLMMYQ